MPITCSTCMEQFQSWIRLQYHLQREHKKPGFFRDGTTTVTDYSKAWKAPRQALEDTFKEQTGNVGY